jgi:hypothetical protein
MVPPICVLRTDGEDAGEAAGFGCRAHAEAAEAAEAVAQQL